MTATVLLSPHLDDAVLSLWHVLAAPDEATVVNVFAGVPHPDHDGDPWWDLLTGAEDSAVRMRERRAEDREALALAGRTAIDLDLLESQYRAEAQALEPLLKRLSDEVPDGARLLAPAALDGHRSHRLVRAAALVLRARGAGGTPVTLYADVPHATRYGWPPWVSGARVDRGVHPDACWRYHMRGTAIALDDLQPRVHRLDDAGYERKLAAVQAYRTQVPALEAEFGLVSRPDVLRYEVVWPLP